MFSGFSILLSNKIGKINTLKKKKQTFLTEWKKIFFTKEEKENESKKKAIKVRIEIFQKNKRERNLKAINCQKLLCVN